LNYFLNERAVKTATPQSRDPFNNFVALIIDSFGNRFSNFSCQDAYCAVISLIPLAYFLPEIPNSALGRIFLGQLTQMSMQHV
jgi:hypothetical protein